MQVMDIQNAQHFCGTFGGTAAKPPDSLKDFLKASRRREVFEGTTTFDRLRDALLRDAERCLVLAASNYRRSLDLMMPASAPWAHVTLYYSSWFGAHAILQMLGGYVDAKFHIVDVAKANAGKQVLRHIRGERATVNNLGGHQGFWEGYYYAMNTHVITLPTNLRKAVTPVSSNTLWQIQMRNKFNYDTFHAFDMAQQFKPTFDASRYPKCLGGDLATQQEVTSTMVELAFWVADQVGLNTDSLNRLDASGLRKEKIKALIFDPSLPGIDPKPLMAQCGV